MNSERNYKQSEKTPLRMGEIIANKTIDKELTSKIYKQFMQLNARKNEQPNQKVGKRPKQTFLQRRHTYGKKKKKKKNTHT